MFDKDKKAKSDAKQLTREEILAQAKENARKAREAIGEDTLNEIRKSIEKEMREKKK